MIVKGLIDVYFKNGNAEKFYMQFYSQVAVNPTTFFPGLSRKAATLLSTKVADGILALRKKSKSSDIQESENTANSQLSEQENASLQYLGGYVLHNLYKKCSRKQSPANEQAMAILKAGKLEEPAESQKLVCSLNRGGLWYITRPAECIFLYTERYFRQFTPSHCQAIDITGITKKAMVDTRVITSYQTLTADSELSTTNSINKDVLQSIISLYIRVRSHSYARDVIEHHKMKSKTNKGKALRKEIKRSCDQEELERSL